jgi:SAM-dependent methyltransferase
MNNNIVKVDKERWEKAQAWERGFWIESQKQMVKYGKMIIWKLLAAIGLKPKYRGDDWNYWWKRQFDDYIFLPNAIDNAVELGCGPYTNIRLMLDKCSVRHIFLSDPLIQTYVKFKTTYVSDMYRRGLCNIDDHPIEECPFASNYYELVIMINVLDHVQDAEICIEKAINITKPGGILIIGQDLSNEDDITRLEKRIGLDADIGHPIRLAHEWLDQFIIGKFDPIIYRILPRELGRVPEFHYGTYIFAGRKR